MLEQAADWALRLRYDDPGPSEHAAFRDWLARGHPRGRAALAPRSYPDGAGRQRRPLSAPTCWNGDDLVRNARSSPAPVAAGRTLGAAGARSSAVPAPDRRPSQRLVPIARGRGWTGRH
ncbi:FecR/PupR family sigma factor regulator [Paracoccus mutanolyticus]|uniref:FecR/PupR family sigma factor regulator n=1 Tax=Paracoccus mutanolyticus TaxID=1499308 RepID=UPI0016795CA8